jgi:hypothetical protein
VPELRSELAERRLKPTAGQCLSPFKHVTARRVPEREMRGAKKAARVFGGLRAEQCSQKFTFGHKGKPLYRRGPRETEEQARGIVWHLQQRCGSGNFEYLVMPGEVGDIDRSFEE